jgi:hypothetical protein
VQAATAPSHQRFRLRWGSSDDSARPRAPTPARPSRAHGGTLAGHPQTGAVLIEHPVRFGDVARARTQTVQVSLTFEEGRVIRDLAELRKLNDVGPRARGPAPTPDRAGTRRTLLAHSGARTPGRQATVTSAHPVAPKRPAGVGAPSAARPAARRSLTSRRQRSHVALPGAAKRWGVRNRGCALCRVPRGSANAPFSPPRSEADAPRANGAATPRLRRLRTLSVSHIQDDPVRWPQAPMKTH